MELKLVATLVVIALSAALTWIGRRLGEKSPGLDNGLLAIAMLLALWLPQNVRDFVMIFVAVMLGMIGGRVLAVTAGALTFGIAVTVPGGTIVVLLGLCALLAYVSARQERGRLISLMKAALLVPGEDKQIEVAVLGPASSRGVRRPDTGEPVAAWWAHCVADGETLFTTASDAEITIDTESGTARAAPDNIDLPLLEMPGATLVGDAAAELAARLGHDDGGDAIESLRITWLERGASVFVKGVPVWEASRDGGGYRDSNFVPVFRAGESNRVTLKLGTLQQLKNKILYSIVMWGCWALPCAGIAAIQIALDLG